MSQVFHRRLRVYTAVLWLAGVVLCAVAVVPAFTRLGVGAATTFIVVALALTTVATGVLRAARWALVVSAISLGGQLLAVAGAGWELIYGIDAGKARELRLLGFDPTFAVTVNLVYSTCASVLFAWLVLRWHRARADQAHTGRSPNPPAAEHDTTPAG